MDDSRYVHHSDPFETPVEHRSPARRLRGRLVSGVSIWTAGQGTTRTGLTVSSMVVAEGVPSVVLGLVNDTTTLWDTIHHTRAFIVHVLGDEHRELSERFAGLRPSPGGLFTGLRVTDGDWGPVVADLANRVYCRYLSATPAGYQQLVRGEIERIELDDLADPLVFHRGRYRRLA